MAGALNPAAPHYLPPFITPPGETDVLLVVMLGAILLVVLGIGTFYFRLHALPEKMAHEGQSTQLQLVGILALLALFTHNNLFWVGALLIAAFKVPDYATPLNAIAEAVGNLTARGDRLERALGGPVPPEPEGQLAAPAHDMAKSTVADGPSPVRDVTESDAAPAAHPDQQDAKEQ